MQRFFKRRGISTLIRASDLKEVESSPQQDEQGQEIAPKEPPAGYHTVSLIVSIMIAISAVFNLFNAWELRIWAAYLNDPWISAAFNLNQAEIVSEANARQNYTVYSYYLINDQLEEKLSAEITDFADPEQADLVGRYDQAQMLAYSNRYFFPGRYLDPNGKYNLERDREESMAEFRRTSDINPQYHKDYAYSQIHRRRIFLDGSLVLAFSLGILGFEKLFYWERRSIRYILIVVGVSLLVIGIVNYAFHDPNPLYQLRAN